ncbi:MAG: TIGR00282 family metallophosphoesterase [Nitrospirota bacterium]
MNLLFIGDIIGEPGRMILARKLGGLIKSEGIDLVVANGENAAGGFGITPKIAKELFDQGVDVITSGNHVFDKKEIVDYIKKEGRLLRPANYPEGVAGSGSIIVETRTYDKVGIIHLMGRIFMLPIDCPFRTARQEIARIKRETRAIIIDLHAEATSEKMALGWYLDGEVSAVIGTHTHVQTADETILPKGTAYITDAGMTGPINSVIGIRKEEAIDKFLTQTPRRFEIAGGPSLLSGVIVDIDPLEGMAKSIRRIQIRDDNPVF